MHLINSYHERHARHREKTLLLLMFLKEETYSNFATLQKLLNISAHQPLYRLLAKVIKQGLVQQRIFDYGGGKITLWGITQQGIAVVLQPNEPFPNAFEPSKLSGWSLQHHLLNQKVRLILESKGATHWLHGDRKHFLSLFKVKHRPDGVATLPNGQRFAVETERRLKTRVRYQEIMKSHLLARTNEDWFFVYYIVPDDQMKLALMALFNSITFLTFNGKPMTLETKHRNIFKFYTVDELAVPGGL